MNVSQYLRRVIIKSVYESMLLLYHQLFVKESRKWKRKGSALVNQPVVDKVSFFMTSYIPSEKCI